jgi:hypothetical protein
MEPFDYTAPAELFACLHRSKRAALTYRRFATSAEAIQFAIEELSPDLLNGSVIEVSEQRLEARQIRELYQSSEFPLERASAAST